VGRLPGLPGSAAVIAFKRFRVARHTIKRKLSVSMNHP